MTVVVATPEPAQVVTIAENQAIVVIPPTQVLPLVVQPNGPSVVVSPSTQVMPVLVESGGPQGPSGEGGDLHFKFIQGVASNKWIIVHNLEKFPIPLVQDSANDEIEGDIEYVSINELIITFSAAFSGIAYLN